MALAGWTAAWLADAGQRAGDGGVGSWWGAVARRHDWLTEHPTASADAGLVVALRACVRAAVVPMDHVGAGGGHTEGRSLAVEAGLAVLIPAACEAQKHARPSKRG